MGELEVVFDVPDWVEAGVKAGDLRIFGGVVREVGGPIAHHLQEAMRREPSEGASRFGLATAIGVAIGAVAVGGAYLVYRRFSRKQRVLEALEAVDNKMTTYLVNARDRDLNLSDVQALSTALATFLGIRRRPEFHDVQITVPDEVYQKLRDFLRSLQAFNEAAHEQLFALPAPPPATITDGTSIDWLLDDLLEQAFYQESAFDLVNAA
jgi:hypothetical protein